MNKALATNPNPEVMSWLFCEIPTNSKALASVNYMLASPRYNAFRPDQDAVDYVFKSAAGAGNIGLMEALLSMPVLRPNPNKAFAAAAEVGDIMIMSFVYRYSIENQIENQDGADNAFYNAATHKKDDVAMYLLTGQNGFPTPSVKMMARVLQLDPEIVSAGVLDYMRQHHAEDIAAEKNRQVVAKAEAQRQFEATQRLATRGRTGKGKSARRREKKVFARR